jgi:transposase
MTYDESIALNKSQAAIIAKLTHELEQLKRLIYGSKSERFKPTPIDINQGNLFADDQVEIIEAEQVVTQTITYDRKTPKKHEGRNEIPDHLPVEIVVIEPEEDTTGMVKIGDEETISLEYTKASLIKKITRRPKYAKANGEGVIIAQLPSRPIDKCIAEASLLSHIIISKFIDHLYPTEQVHILELRNIP